MFYFVKQWRLLSTEERWQYRRVQCDLPCLQRAMAAVEIVASSVQLTALQECCTRLSSGTSPPSFVWIYFPFPTQSLAPNAVQQILSNWHGEWSQPELCQVPPGLCSLRHCRPALHSFALLKALCPCQSSSGDSHNRSPLTFILARRLEPLCSLQLFPLFPVRNVDSETLM